MKLVDILARELKGWPEGVRRIEQDSSGVSPLTLIERLPPKILPEKVSESAEDSETAIVTRAEWQAAVDALKDEKSIEWDGEGLPPVGGLYEYNDNFAWCACKVIAYANGKVVFTRQDYPESVYVAGDDEIKFRPIRTPEQIAAEEREAAIREMAEIIGNRIADIHAAEDLYKAGYRKQEQK